MAAPGSTVAGKLMAIEPASSLKINAFYCKYYFSLSSENRMEGAKPRKEMPFVMSAAVVAGL